MNIEDWQKWWGYEKFLGSSNLGQRLDIVNRKWTEALVVICECGHSYAKHSHLSQECRACKCENPTSFSDEVSKVRTKLEKKKVAITK